MSGKEKEQGGNAEGILVNEEKGLKPAENPPPMPEVKPPASEKGDTGNADD